MAIGTLRIECLFIVGYHHHFRLVPLPPPPLLLRHFVRFLRNFAIAICTFGGATKGQYGTNKLSLQLKPGRGFDGF